MQKIAIIRVRGNIRVDGSISDSLDMLRLYRQNYCVVFEKTPSIIGMIKKIKDYVTWGEIDEETIKLLLKERGEADPKDKNNAKKFFRLSPPKGGFERKGIKRTYNEGGVLGYRGEKIKELIMKMI